MDKQAETQLEDGTRLEKGEAIDERHNASDPSMDFAERGKSG